MAYLLCSELNKDIITHIEKFLEKPWNIRKNHNRCVWTFIYIELKDNDLWISHDGKPAVAYDSPRIPQYLVPRSIKRYVGRSEIVCYHWYR